MIRILLLCVLLPGPALAESLRLAATTSFGNSGLVDVLLPRIAEDTGADVDLFVRAKGQALRLGATGDVDTVPASARAAEERSVAADHATHRREIIDNDIVVVGPAADPAGRA